MEDYCVACGAVIPEGLLVCPDCEEKARKQYIEWLFSDEKRRRDKNDQNGSSE